MPAPDIQAHFSSAVNGRTADIQNALVVKEAAESLGLPERAL